MFKRKRASYNEALAETQTIRRVCWWYPSIKNVLEGYTTLWWKTALTDGCKWSLMHLSLWILLIMAKIEIFHRQRPPWPSLYLSTGLEDRRSYWHVLMHSVSCQDAQNICDDKMWCWMYTEAGMTLQCPGVGGRGRSPLIIGCPLASAYTPYTSFLGIPIVHANAPVAHWRSLDQMPNSQSSNPIMTHVSTASRSTSRIHHVNSVWKRAKIT